MSGFTLDGRSPSPPAAETAGCGSSKFGASPFLGRSTSLFDLLGSICICKGSERTEVQRFSVLAQQSTGEARRREDERRQGKRRAEKVEIPTPQTRTVCAGANLLGMYKQEIQGGRVSYQSVELDEERKGTLASCNVIKKFNWPSKSIHLAVYLSVYLSIHLSL